MNHVLGMDICLIKITERKYRETTIKQIMISVTALFNSSGGTLYLNYEKLPQSVQAKHIKDLIRMIEQRIQELTTCFTVSELTLETSSNQLTISLNGRMYITTLNYNLYLPSDSQVMALPPHEPVENIKAILQKTPTKRLPEKHDPVVYGQVIPPSNPNENDMKMLHRKPATPLLEKPVYLAAVQGQPQVMVVLPSIEISTNHVPEKPVHPDFVQGDFLERTNKCVAHKFLKESPSKRVTIADRIIGNKLSAYVSAFANHTGGAIYYGIKEDGTVIGERITEKEKETIRKKVTKTMNNMVGPGNYGQRGTHWDISFHAIVDANRSKIPLTYVIVIFICQCPGGVFIEEPESYHIENERVVKTPFQTWFSRITGTSFVAVPIPPHVPRVHWSSSKKRKIYSEVTTRLVHYRNENMIKKFEKFSQLVVSMYCSDACLVVISETFAIALKQHRFCKAKSLICEFEESLVKSADPLIFDVRRSYMKSRIERAEGNFQESYATAKVGIAKMQLIPAEFMTVWFYIHTATVAIILSSQEELPRQSHSLREEAKMLLGYAKRDANALEESPEKVWDLQQKLYIYTTCVLLGYSLTGETIDGSRIADSDIREATYALMSVHQSTLSAKLPTQFRKIQYVLVQSDLHYRYGQRLKHQPFENLKRAFELASEAQSLAREYRFQEMVHYASKRLARLTETLLRLRSKNLMSCAEDDFKKCVKNIGL